MAADTDKSTEQPENQPATEADGPVLEWKVHPAVSRPWVTLLVTVFIVVVSMLVWMISGKWFAVFALVVIFASLAKFYFPTSYRLDAKGITIKTTTQTLKKQWSLYRSYYPDKNGVLLSPFVEPSRLENFRGLYVLFGGKREEVMSIVEHYMKKSAPGSGDDSGDKE